MKYLLLSLIIMSTKPMTAQDGVASTTKKTFSRETIVSTRIEADPTIIWTLLTQASDYARWNSTIVSLNGEIKLGEKIELVSTLDPKRTFKLKVKEFTPDQQLAWGDGLGTRTYTLESLGDSATQFTMHEKIGGPVFPLFAKMIPPFDESFEQFAEDLKKEAETIQQAQ